MTTEIERLKSERAELLRLAVEPGLTPVAGGPNAAERRTSINAQLLRLAADEQGALRAWLDNGRLGDKPAMRDAERRKLYEELAAVRDEDGFAAEQARVATARQAEFGRVAAGLTRQIEAHVHDRLVEHVESEINAHIENLRTCSKSLARLGGLQRALFDIAREHGRAGRPSLESAVNVVANRLSDSAVLQLTELPDAADESRQDFEHLVTELRV